MLMRTLKASGHTGEEAEDGQMAVDKVKENGVTTYDAILMDFVMPVMDGPDATKAIRALGHTAPIIGCTGNTLDMDVERFKESNCDRVIGKPFEPELFHQYMTDLTGGQSSPLVTSIEQSSPLPDASPQFVVAQQPLRKKSRPLISSGKGITAGVTGPRYKVLVVDDSAMSRKVTRHILL